jgi:RNA polymerase sigma-70 factor (ECF subfamily)
MISDPSNAEVLIARALDGDDEAFNALFDRFQDRLQKMVRLRLDRRLRGIVESADVLKAASASAKRRLPQYAADRSLPIFLWLRAVTGEMLSDIHHERLGSLAPGAGQEVTLYRGALPEAPSISLAAQLLGKLTVAGQAAIQADLKLKVQEVLNSLEPLDREVLTLRHFEKLSNEETALALGIKKSAASERYIRALTRLHETLSAIPGFKDKLMG